MTLRNNMVANTTLRRLVDAVHEYEEWFPKYCISIENSLEIVAEINGYIRERCGPVITKKTTRQLDEIQRDICIIRSRYCHLQLKLHICVKAMQRAVVFSRSKTRKPDAVALRIQECTDCVMEWRRMEKEFVKSFQAAEKKWHDLESRILQQYEQ